MTEDWFFWNWDEWTQDKEVEQWTLDLLKSQNIPEVKFIAASTYEYNSSPIMVDWVKDNIGSNYVVSDTTLKEIYTEIVLIPNEDKLILFKLSL